MKIDNKRRLLEIIAVILTGLGKFIFMDWLNVKFVYIASAVLFWLLYVIYRYRQNKEIIQYWGLNTQNFKRTFIELSLIGIALVIGFICVGNYLGTNVLNWRILPILLLYPIWGIIQQFIMIGVFAKNLKDIEPFKLPNILIIILTAVLFSVVHYPFTLLITGTFFLALVYTSLYFKERNLIVMGIFHGWIGAFFYYTVLGQDAYEEVFGVLIGG